MKPAGILFFVLVGVLLILIGFEGNIGSVLGSIIDPGSMVAGVTSTTPATEPAPVGG